MGWLKVAKISGAVKYNATRRLLCMSCSLCTGGVRYGRTGLRPEYLPVQESTSNTTKTSNIPGTYYTYQYDTPGYYLFCPPMYMFQSDLELILNFILQNRSDKA